MLYIPPWQKFDSYPFSCSNDNNQINFMSLVSLRLVDSVGNNKADSKIEKENVYEKELQKNIEA